MNIKNLASAAAAVFLLGLATPSSALLCEGKLGYNTNKCGVGHLGSNAPTVKGNIGSTSDYFSSTPDPVGNWTVMQTEFTCHNAGVEVVIYNGAFQPNTYKFCPSNRPIARRSRCGQLCL